MKVGDLVKFRNPLVSGVGVLVTQVAPTFWNVALGSGLVCMYAGDMEVVSASR
jgi:hypothetical protein